MENNSVLDVSQSDRIADRDSTFLKVIHELNSIKKKLDRVADHYSTFLQSFKIVKHELDSIKKNPFKLVGRIQLNEYFYDAYGQQSMYNFGEHFVTQAGILCVSSL